MIINGIFKDSRRLWMEYLSMFFWLFFIFSLLTPWLRKKNLEASRISLIDRIEKEKKSRIIALIHRQETMSILGIPLIRYINIEDSEAVLRAIRLTDPDLPIDIILHTPGKGTGDGCIRSIIW